MIARVTHNAIRLVPVVAASHPGPCVGVGRNWTAAPIPSHGSRTDMWISRCFVIAQWWCTRPRNDDDFPVLIVVLGRRDACCTCGKPVALQHMSSDTLLGCDV